MNELNENVMIIIIITLIIVFRRIQIIQIIKTMTIYLNV